MKIIYRFLEGVSSSISAKRASKGIVWRAYRKKIWNGKPHISPLRKTLIYGFARLKLRHVRHATFEQLSSAGHDVQTFDDGAKPLDSEEVPHGNLPKSWKCRQPVLTPRVATLRNAVLFSDGIALLRDGRICFSNTIYLDVVRRRAPHGPEKALRFIDPATDSALILRRLRILEVPGRCFSTRSCFPRNFGHFVHDVLTRIYYEDLGAIVPGRDKVIAPPFRLPMQDALFKMIFEGYEIVQVPDGTPLKVEMLLLPANLCSDMEFNPAAVEALAERMRRIMKPYAGKERRKVCISRRDGNLRSSKGNFARDFANVEAYETRMRQLGFDVVQASTLAPDTQFALWANTTDIVGVHGAGMMNMIIMPTRGNYTEIFGAPVRPDAVGREHWPKSTIRCAMAAGHRVCGISSGLDPQGRPAIDIQRLEAEVIHPAQ